MRLSVYVRLMLALVAGAVLPGPGVQAEELRLIGASVSFYCYPAAGEAAGVSGLACDLVHEMARRVGHLSKIQLYPLPRATWNGILAAQRQIGANPATLRRGVVLKRVQAYMASSPDVTPAQVADWKAAMAEMMKDGTYERILKKYQFVLPK